MVRSSMRIGVVIREIRGHFHGLSAILLFCDLMQIYFENIGMHNFYITSSEESILQNWNQIVIQFHRKDFASSLRQHLSQRSHTRTDLENKVILCYACSIYHRLQNTFVHKEVLTVLLLKTESMSTKNSLHIDRVGQMFHSFAFLNKSKALFQVISSTSSREIPFISAIFFTISGIYLESFRLPRYGSGAI